ncbi:Phosphatidylserine decarboxylase proenzyme [Roseimaritima multifibrata]|uniref:Phosphatidylserine decarboxylase proenzyme n=1 Tax=Roseimaritima multifibrata TaxID=1930274 RepID=A0A517M9B8_9BACT|nr:phosphatidylserine decarboxylase [Roseimaritima multifibrata]QDS91472.1 Phosphatidylserine decarboxylase proenzyme [Roseimaritima multifibrata]
MNAIQTSDPITYFNRYSGELEQEEIYGESFLRWTYQSFPGQIALAVAAKRVWFSKWYGRRMDSAVSREKVLPFIKTYGLDPAEFLDPPESFQTFNEFFYRKLKPAARPIDAAVDSLVFPADGRQLVVPDISQADGFWVKGQRMDLARLLGSRELAERYQHGSLLISRLCPVDYHRYHFPIAGTAGAAKMIPGSLSSVSPIALRKRLAILWENKRTLTEIQTATMGTVLMIEVGAACVGGIHQTFSPGAVAKGDDKGYFTFGGSMTMVLMEPKRIRFSDDLLEHSAQQREVYARMGDVAGHMVD